MVTLVCGPPCAGKTTYVRERSAPGDLVLDADVIGEASMRVELRKLERGQPAGNVWVIRSCPTSQARAELARRLHADHVVLLVPPTAVLMARARARLHGTHHMHAVRAWLDAEGGRASAPRPGRHSAW